jgi:cell volume regulation protein A
MADGDATRPDHVMGREVIENLRIRRDAPGSLAVLDDGRYALCGAVVAVGARQPVMAWASRRMRSADDEERAWLRTVIGALAADAAEAPLRDNR